MKLLTALALALLTQAPAFADYIVQQPGDTCATRKFIGATVPNPGVNCPAGSFWCVWSVQNGDLNIQDYSITSGNAQVYTAPIVPAPVAYPDPSSAEKAILADTTITNAAKLELFKYKALLDSYATDPAGTKQAWAAIKAADPAIDPTSAGLVEQYCAQYAMPLV